MNPQVVTKAVKALVAVAVAFGLDIDDQTIEHLVQGSLAVVAIAYVVEAWLKRRKNQIRFGEQ